VITDPAKAMVAQFYLQVVFKEHGVLVTFSTKESAVMDVPQRWEVLRRAINFYQFADKSIALPGRPSRETYATAFEWASGLRLNKPGEVNAREESNAA
jgi:hypothetical protein